MGDARDPKDTARALAGALAMPYRYLRPRPADRAFLAGLDDAGLPAGSTTVRVQRLDQVVREVPAFVVAEGVRRPRTVGNTLTSFVVRHPEATVLVDPAVCKDVERRVLRDLPLILRPVVRPRRGTVPAAEAVERAGIALDGIDFALPTHLHWDHVSGLLDMPGLPVALHAVEHDWMTRGERAPAGGVRSALRDRRVDRYELDGPPALTFERSHDLFGDGSVVLVDLAGHTPGSIGVLLRTAEGPVLLAGDAAWHGVQIDCLRQKAPFPGLVVDADREQTFRTLHRLHAVRERVGIIAAHDAHA